MVLNGKTYVLKLTSDRLETNEKLRYLSERLTSFDIHIDENSFLWAKPWFDETGNEPYWHLNFNTLKAILREDYRHQYCEANNIAFQNYEFEELFNFLLLFINQNIDKQKDINVSKEKYIDGEWI